jgi:hypothetical protein
MRADTHDSPEQTSLHSRGLIHCCSSHVVDLESPSRTARPGHTCWHICDGTSDLVRQADRRLDHPQCPDRKRPSQKSLLCRVWVRGHRSVIMFGVLVVVLCPDRVADYGFSTGKREISLIVSLRVLRALRLGTCGTRYPPLRAGSKRRSRSVLARTHNCLWAILHGSLLWS